VDGGTSHVGYGSVSSISGFLVNQPAETLGTNLDFRRFSVSSSYSLTTAGSGTHALVSTANFAEPDITIGTAGVTTSATVYIAGAASEAGANYALLVAGGNSQFNGDIDMNDNDLENVGASGNDWTGSGITTTGTIDADEYTGFADVSTRRWSLGGTIADPGGAALAFLRIRQYEEGATTLRIRVTFKDAGHYAFVAAELVVTLAKEGSTRGEEVGADLAIVSVATGGEGQTASFDINQVSNDTSYADYDLRITNFNTQNYSFVRGIVTEFAFNDTSPLMTAQDSTVLTLLSTEE
jgi:hypothetical protein